MTSPVMFYFWAHDIRRADGSKETNLDELQTGELFRCLEKANKAFVEFVAGEEEITGRIEGDWNAYVKDGTISKELEYTITHNLDQKMMFLAGNIKLSKRRFVFERSPPAPFDYDAEEITPRDFFKLNLSEVRTLEEAFVKKDEAYEVEREKRVAAQICGIKGPLLVIFGAGHPTLAELVGKVRPVEIHFPYDGYPVSYNIQMRMQYRKTKALDEELWLRSHMEQVTYSGLRTAGFTPRARDLVAHEYARTVQLDQIVALRDYINSASRLGFPGLTIFEGFLKKADLPTVDSVCARVAPQEPARIQPTKRLLWYPSGV
ncbi:hypothetical protein HY642_03135 [Candidatus Woesearchaeota archaeon]|nr:hypothetical protein [Candidatus Woesearchaeota archaeon]